DGAVAIGKEVDGVAYPHRIEVVRVLAGNLIDTGVLEISDLDGCGLAAPITLPRLLSLRMRDIGHPRTIRRDCRRSHNRERIFAGEGSINRNGEHFGIEVI